MATLTNAEARRINRMNRAAQDTDLGTRVQVLEDGGAGSEIPERLSALEDMFGSHEVTAGEETAETLDIDSGNESAVGFIVQIYRAGVNVTADAEMSLASGVLTIDGATTYEVTEGDVINYIIF